MYHLLCTKDLTYIYQALEGEGPQTHKADNEVELRGITVGVGVPRMGRSLVWLYVQG